VACREEVVPGVPGPQGVGDESEDPTVVPSPSEASSDQEGEEHERGLAGGAAEPCDETAHGTGAQSAGRVPHFPLWSLECKEGLAGGIAEPAGAGAEHAQEDQDDATKYGPAAWESAIPSGHGPDKSLFPPLVIGV